MKKYRKEKDPPNVTSKFGWRFHHIGIPTSTPRADEKYLENYRMYVSGFETSNYGVEWMRFEDGSPVSEIIQRIPHIAFEVDNLDKAIEGKTLIGEITTPSPGIRVAMIIEDGAPVELLEFAK